LVARVDALKGRKVAAHVDGRGQEAAQLRAGGQLLRREVELGLRPGRWAPDSVARQSLPIPRCVAGAS
ncbi:MAG: hypothetical protein ACK55I_19490, partial [bacterium]